MGSLTELTGGRWRVRWDLPPDPVTGSRRQRSLTIRGTRREAARRLAELEGEVEAGRWSDPTRIPFTVFRDRWLEAVRPAVRPSTWDAYRDKATIAARHLGRVPISRIDGGQLTALYGRLLADYAPRTVLHVHRVVHRMLADAVRWRLIPGNPAERATPPKVPKRQLNTWTAEQLAGFLEAAERDRLASLWRVAATTGMRRGELVGLPWRAVHGDSIEVLQTIVATGQGPVLSEPKTAAGRRRVALDAGTVAELRQWRAAQAEERLFFGPGYRDHGLVWCWDDGRPLGPDWLTKRFRQLAADAGLPAIRFHDLRHTWATLALQAGVPAKVVSDRLGHAGIAITLDTYTQRVGELDRTAAETVAAMIGGTPWHSSPAPPAGTTSPGPLAAAPRVGAGSAPAQQLRRSPTCSPGSCSSPSR